MLGKCYHWSPCGCGKTCIYVGEPRKGDEIYECLECGKKFSKKEIENA